MFDTVRSWKKAVARVFTRQGAGRPHPRRNSPTLEALEDRFLPTAVWISATQNGAEGGANGYFRLSRDNTSGSLAVTYQIDTSVTTATNGVDFSYLPGTSSGVNTGTVTFASGNSTVDIPVTVTDDSLTEGTEALGIDLLSGGSGGGCCCGGGSGSYTLSSPSSATLTIADNDVPTVWIDSVANAQEGVAAGYFRLKRDLTVNPTTVNFEVDPSSTATNGTDFPYLSGTSAFSSHGTVSFAAGQATVDIAVNPTGAYDDALVEGPETVKIDLDPSTGSGCSGSGLYSLGSPGSATLTIADNDTAPVASNDSYTLHGASLSVAAPGVLSNDTDPDGGVLTAHLVSGPAHGSLTLNINGSFTYTPTSGFTGTDSFTYKANDGALDSNTATVTITGHAPVANADSYSLPHDSTLTISASGVLGNDTDADGDALTASLVSGPANGSLTLNSNGSFTYTPDSGFVGNDSFTYKANDGFLDSNTATVSLNVDAVTIDICYVPGTGQEGTPVSFWAQADTTGGGTLTYTWDYGDGNTDNGTNLTDVSHTFAAPATADSPYTVTLTVTDGIDTATATGSIVIEDEPPDVNAGPSQTVHAGDTVNFQGSVTDPGGSGDIASEQWDFNYDGSTFNPDSSADGTLTPSHTYSTTGTYLVALQATDQGGNSTLDVTAVVVKNAGALLVNAGADQDVTPGTSASFSGSYSDPGGTVSSGGIAWDFDYDGATFTADSSAAGTLTPTHTFSAPGTYFAALSVTDSNAVTDISVLTVTVDDYVGPAATAGADQTIDKGDTVTFSGSYTDSDGTVSSSDVAWDFDYDGTFTADTTGTLTPSHQYLPAGDHEVALQVTDNHGVSSLSVLTVAVNNVAPTVDAGSDVTVSAGDTAAFSGSFTDPGGTTGASFAWDFDYDGTTFNPSGATTLTPSHTFTTAGTYTVALQVTDADGDSGLDTLTVTVNSSSSALVVDAGPDVFADQGDSVAFDGSYAAPSGATGPYTIEWDFDYNGTFSADSTGTLTPSHTFDAPGTYLVALRVTSSNSYTGLGTLYIQVADVPPTVDAGSDQEIDVGDTASFSGTATDVAGSGAIASIAWDFDYDGATFNADATGSLTPSHTYDAASTYQVALQVTDAWGGVSLSTLSVTVDDVAPTATVTNDGPGEEGSPVTFTVSGLSAPDGAASVTYWVRWSASDDFQALAASDLTAGSGGSVSFGHTWDDNGSYAVTVRVMDDEGLYTDYTQTVDVANVAPTATSFGAAGSVIGLGTPLTFQGVSDPSQADTAAGFTYYYKVDSGSYSSSSSSQFYLPDYTPGYTHTVTAYIEDKDGGDSTTYTATVTVAAGTTVVANHGTGTVEVNGVAVGPDEYVVLTGAVSVSATLEDGGDSYDLQTNGSFGVVSAASGVTGVDLTVDTTVIDLSGLTAASGSASLPSSWGFYGTGDMGEVDLPGGGSRLALYARGDLGSIAGPSSSAMTGAKATDVYFANLTGSITGLDSIGSLVASGLLEGPVTVNSGIESLTAYGIEGTVTGDTNFDASDLDETVFVGAGGVPGVVDMGNLASFFSGADVNKVAAQQLKGPLDVAGNVNLVMFQDAKAPAELHALGDFDDVVGAGEIKFLFANGNIKKMEVKDKGGASGSLKVVEDIHAFKSIGSITAKSLTVGDSITAGTTIGPITITGDLTVTKDIRGTTGIGAIKVDGNVTAKEITAPFGALDTITVGKDLTASVVAGKGGINAITVGKNFTTGEAVLVKATKRIGKITAGGKMGPGTINGGSIGTISAGGDITVTSIGADDGIDAVLATNGTINSAITADGGNILKVEGKVIKGDIRASVANTDWTAGGNIVSVKGTDKISDIKITADRRIGTIVSGTTTKVKVQAEAGAAKFTAAGKPNGVDALQITVTLGNFDGKVTFAEAPKVNARAQFSAPMTKLLAITALNAPLGTNTWWVKQTAGTEKAVTLSGAVVEGMKFKFKPNFYKVGTNTDDDANWTAVGP